MNFVKRLFAGALIFGAAFLLLSQIPVVSTLQLSVHGWGWAVLAVSYVLMLFVGTYAGGFASGLLKLNSGANSFLTQALSWPLMAAALFLGAALVPNLISYSSVVAVLLIAVVVGIADGIDDIVERRIKANAGQ